MSEESLHIGAQAVISRKHFSSLLEAIKRSYCQLLGPRVSEGSLVYAEIDGVADLPIGIRDQQRAGSYRLSKSDLPTLFGYVVGQHSWKRFLHLPDETLWQAERHGKSFTLNLNGIEPRPQAFIGVRPCELAALKTHDTVLNQGPYADPSYQRRRESAFVLAVNCIHPGGTCFCSSMNTGPRALDGFDLALTEVCTEKEHYFLVDIGSERGAAILKGMTIMRATKEQKAAADRLLETASSSMGRELDTDGVKELLQDQFDSLHWEDIARRCLSCANCTMVCPTCFCSNVEDQTDLTGAQVERRRRWDSCYSIDFSYIHGGSIRTGAAARYRQWLTHKLSYWVDQFGSFGCVGCGRCITWCPAAIDLTEEIKVFRAAATESEAV